MYVASDNSKMDIQLCNDNNDSSEPNSSENTINNDVGNDSAEIINCDKPKTDQVNDLNEFEQVFSKYKEQQRNSDNNTEITRLNTRNASIATATIIEMGIDLAETASNTNNFNTRQVDVNPSENYNNNFEKPDMNENLPINNIQDNLIKEETIHSIKTEVDTISLSSDEVNITENDQNLDLIALTNINVSNNVNKSTEIEIDIKNELADEDILSPSGLSYTNFDIDDIEFCENSNINDSNTVIDLTDSPNISLLELKTAEMDVITTQTNNISNIENPLYLENGCNETKDIHIYDNESECSFHSSDFELITEEEARMDGLIINFRQQNEFNNTNAHHNANIIDMCLPGPSNDYSYRENHRIPEGDEFFNMFHGIYAPANIPDLIFLENKSVVPSQCMNVEGDKFGFDLAALNKEVFHEEYQDEAKETAKKILNSYRNDNEGKRRRRPL